MELVERTMEDRKVASFNALVAGLYYTLDNAVHDYYLIRWEKQGRPSSWRSVSEVDAGPSDQSSLSETSPMRREAGTYLFPMKMDAMREIVERPEVKTVCEIGSVRSGCLVSFKRDD